MTKPKIGRPAGSSTNAAGLKSLRSESKEHLEALYEGGKTTREIGILYGVSRTAVDNRFKALGIPRRWHDETGKWKNAKMSIGLSLQQEQLMLGSLLGDGCLHRQPFKRASGCMVYYGKVTFAHGLAQLGYLSFKRDILLKGREHLPKTCVSNISARPEGSNLGKQMFQFSFSHDPTVREMEKKFEMRDAADRIMVSRKWVDALGPEALAYWFLDDGSLLSKSSSTADRMTFFTNAYETSELDLLLGVVSRFGAPSARLNRAREGQYVINVNRHEEIRRLVDIIRTHVPECMLHKLKQI